MDPPQDPSKMGVGPNVYTVPWRGVQAEQVVLVADAYWPQLAGVRFRFIRHVLNTESGAQWVEVFGGPDRKQWVRAFPIHAIRILNRDKAKLAPIPEPEPEDAEPVDTTSDNG